MFPELFHSKIAALDERQLTELVGGLLAAEAGSIGLPAGNFIYSSQVKVADDGLDAEVREVPVGASHFLPDGSSGFQFKAVRGSISALGLEGELGKDGPKRILGEEGTYVLVWGKELNAKQLCKAEGALEEHARKFVEQPKSRVWPVAEIARFCARHPAVPQGLELVRLGPVKSLGEWQRSLKSEERPFVVDAERRDLIEEIRSRLHESGGGLVARIVGDSGVGKSRTVAEALVMSGMSERTLYAPTTDGLDDFLALVRGSDELDMILVVDEVGSGDIDRVIEDVTAAGRRIRLITIGPAGPRRLRPSPTDIELGHLSTEAMTELVKTETGVDDRVAAFVAEAVEGSPQMAFVLLDEIKSDSEAADLGKLAQTRKPRELLERAVPEELRPSLGVLSLFQSVGCHGDLEFQLDELAERFPVSKADLRRTIRDADDRFIRVAGRRCYVRPKLVATWLAGEIIEQHGEEAIGWIQGLSESLQQQFSRQLQNFGSGQGAFQDALSSFVERSERLRRPEDFDDAAGRFLQAAAAAAPEQVVDGIAKLLAAASPEQIRSMPRRSLVWALEYLLWWPETYEQAIASIFVLAEHETESWSNNATGVFVDSFQLALGGTLVPHEERLRWLRSRLEGSNATQLLLIAKAASSGLNSFQTRTSNAPPGLIEPRDWRPSTEAEVSAALRDSFELLLDCIDRAEAGDDQRREIVDVMAQRLRTLVGQGLIDEVEAALTQRRWSEVERARITSELRDIRRYDKPPTELDARVVRLIEQLLGSYFEERLAVVIATKSWDLLESDDWNATPPVIERLVEEIAERPELLARAIDVATKASDEGSQFQLFMKCAAKLGPESVGAAALAHKPPAWQAVAAALTQVDNEELDRWADQVLRTTLEDSPKNFPALLRSVPLTSTRVAMIVSSIEQGTLEGDDYAALLYGAPIGLLAHEDALELVEAIGKTATARGREAALGMLHQWIESHLEEVEVAASTAQTLILKAARSDEKLGDMSAHYLEKLIEDVPMTFTVKAEIWRELVRHGDIGESRRSLWLIGRLLEEDPAEASALIEDLLTEAAQGSYPRWAYPLEGGKLLSAAAAATSAKEVWNRLSQHEDAVLRVLLRHTRWSGEEPEPLVREFLLSDRLPDLEDEAYVNFSNSLGTVSGPFHLATERERDRARSWLNSLRGTSAENWAERLIASYEKRLEQDRIDDEEEDLFLR